MAFTSVHIELARLNVKVSNPCDGPKDELWLSILTQARGTASNQHVADKTGSFCGNPLHASDNFMLHAVGMRSEEGR